jgi:hypothetical protein
MRVEIVLGESDLRAFSFEANRKGLISSLLPDPSQSSSKKN